MGPSALPKSGPGAGSRRIETPQPARFLPGWCQAWYRSALTARRDAAAASTGACRTSRFVRMAVPIEELRGLAPRWPSEAPYWPCLYLVHGKGEEIVSV